MQLRGLGQRGLGRSPSQNRILCILALKYDIWWQQLNFNDFPKNQRTKFRAIKTVKANPDQNFPPRGCFSGLSWMPKWEKIIPNTDCVLRLKDQQYCKWQIATTTNIRCITHNRLISRNSKHNLASFCSCERIKRLAVWLSGNALASINVVALRQTRLVLYGWPSVDG